MIYQEVTRCGSERASY
uniref:Uncharacterized protein n=1 Tax=Anguilla anguilla TaxID=7936 RepID=A0A0E9S7I4_ANGAN